MSQSLLHTIARRAEALTPDADLLARFTRDRDQSAFEELVKRHGPLVWAACRHLLPDHADAEDAFQAVFLALVRSGGSIRDGRALPAWLHGVAVRIATRAKRAFARRRARERVAALPEADRPVSDGTWDALVAAAHEEVQQLPEAERTAFVLCDLQGVSQPDAAARLGWPLGSLSGRLCKARQRLLDRLAARGIAPAVAVGVGLTAGVASALPDRLFAMVKVFPGAPGAASAVVQGLARVTEVMTMRTKLMATATVLVAAVGLTGGAALLSQADAQQPDVVKEVNKLTGVFEPQDPTKGAAGGPPGKGGPGGTPGGGNTPTGHGGLPSAWPGPGPGMSGFGAPTAPAVEYKFADIKSDRKVFEQTIAQHGKEGWEFCGSEQFGQGELTLVFKKAKPPAVMGGGFGGGPGSGRPGGAGIGFGGGAPGGPGGAIEVEVGGPTRQLFKLDGMTPFQAIESIQKAFPNVRGLSLGMDNETGQLSVRGSAETVKAIAKFVEELNAKTAKPATKPEEAPVVISLKNATAQSMEDVLKKVFPGAQVVAEPRSNTLIVRADAKTLRELEALLKSLDAKTPEPK